jgi:hypothetical protein
MEKYTISENTIIHHGTYRYDFFEFKLNKEKFLWCSLKNNIQTYSIPSFDYGKQRITFDIRNGITNNNIQSVINNEYLFNKEYKPLTQDEYTNQYIYFYTPRIIQFSCIKPICLLDINKTYNNDKYYQNLDSMKQYLNEINSEFEFHYSRKASLLDHIIPSKRNLLHNYLKEQGFDGIYENFSDNQYFVLWNFDKIKYKSSIIIEKEKHIKDCISIAIDEYKLSL